MATPTLSGLLSTALAEQLGTRFGHLAVRYPQAARRVLRALERAGVHQAGWALLALEIHGGGQ